MQQLKSNIHQIGSTSVANPASAEYLVETSLKQYKEMSELLIRLKRHLEGHSVDEIADLLDQFNQMGTDTRDVDKKLEEQLAIFPEMPESIINKLIERKTLQKDIVELIEQTVSKAQTVKSYLANEFKSVRQGRNAISGYRSRSGRQGRIVNRSS